jgi:hypothetical protein
MLDLPERPEVLVAAPQGDASVVQALMALRPSARATAFEVVPREGRGKRRHNAIPAVTLRDLAAVVRTGTVDAALFDHAIDDIVIEALSRHEELEPRDAASGEYSPWARAVRAYWRAGDLEEVAAPFFVSLMESWQPLLRTSAKIVHHHRVLGADLVAGQPMDLYTQYIELARRWIRYSPLRLREIALDSLDPHWWLCLEPDS